MLFVVGVAVACFRRQSHVRIESAKVSGFGFVMSTATPDSESSLSINPKPQALNPVTVLEASGWGLRVHQMYQKQVRMLFVLDCRGSSVD